MLRLPMAGAECHQTDYVGGQVNQSTLNTCPRSRYIMPVMIKTIDCSDINVLPETTRLG